MKKMDRSAGEWFTDFHVPTGQGADGVSALPRRRVLLVSPFYAPSTAVGAKRFSFLAEQFVRAGYDVDVLTLRLHADEPVDWTLPRTGTVHATRNLLPRTGLGPGLAQRAYDKLMLKYAGIPDQFVGWLPASLLVGRRAVRERPPDVIIATGPPFTAFLIGQLLARRCGARLILDYRDPWTGFEWVDVHGKPRRRSEVNRRLERRIVESADAMVFTSKRIRDRFKAHFDESKKKTLAVVTNAFSCDDNIEPKVLLDGYKNILFAGELYGKRRVSDLTDALAVLYRDRQLEGVKVAIHVFGRIRADDWERIKEKNLTHIVYVHEPVEYAEILGFMKGADVLYLPSGISMLWSLPFKLFDYLKVCRPILAITPRGSALAEFMGEIDCGELAHADDLSSIVQAMEHLLIQGKEYSFAGREEYTWEVSGRRYMDLMQNVVAANEERGV